MHRSRTTAAAVIAGVIALYAGTAAQQAPAVQSLRRVLSDLALPGIDSGLREVTTPTTEFGAKALRDTVAAVTARQYLSDSVIVKFRPGTSISAQRAMLALVDGASTPALPSASFDIVALRPGADPEMTAQRLAAQPDVEYAQPRYVIRPAFVPNDPLYSRQWNFPAIDLERAWDINPGAASSITVAVIDTGVAFQSALIRFNTTSPITQIFLPGTTSIDVPFAAAPDLGGSDRFIAPRDFIWDDLRPFDMEGHGTHVTGTIGQLTNNSLGTAGVAFNVRIMPVKVVGGTWDQILGAPPGTDDTVARGIRYAADNGAKVLNLSLGRIGPASPVLQDALSYAVSRGAFVAIAAGNDFLNGNPAQRPADIGPLIEGVLTVGATGRNRQRASYSSTGNYVEIVAPGGEDSADPTEGILQQTFNFDFVFPIPIRAPRFDVFNYLYAQGTSMSTAHVSGFAALLMQQGITDPAAIEAIMKQFATDLGAAGRDDQYGYGLINIRSALRGMGLAR
jgi:serine protease